MVTMTTENKYYLALDDANMEYNMDKYEWIIFEPKRLGLSK